MITLLVILSVPSAIALMALSFVAVVGVMPEQHISNAPAAQDSPA